MTPEEVTALDRPEILAALREHAADAPDDFALRHGRREGWPTRAMAEQIRARRSARAKLAGWPVDDLLYTTRAIQQCSSLPLARFKATLVDGDGIDCCAGLGIDALHLAARGRVIACERDPALAAILRRNAAVLGIDLEVVAEDGLAVVARLGDRSRDWIYADPDRRDARDRRQTALGDCEPDLTRHVGELARVAAVLLVNLAPAVDREVLRRELPHLQRLVFVSHRGECKEALARCNAAAERPERIATEAVLLDDAGAVRHHLVAGGETMPETTPPQAVVCEPDPAILRAGALAACALTHGLTPLHPQVAYLTGEAAPSDFPGRVLQVVEAGEYRPKDLRRRLRDQGITGCQIARRHFPHSPETIAAQLRLKGSGTHRLLCYRDPGGKPRYVLGIPS